MSDTLSPPWTPTDDPGERIGPRRAGNLSTAAAVVGLALPVAAWFWYIHHYGVNAIWYDQWEDVSLISHTYSHTLSIGTLWSQHNENRIFFPNLIVILLARTTGFNIVIEQYLSGLMLVVATGLLIVTHRRRSPSTPLIFYCPVAFVMLTFAQGGAVLWGFNLSWYLVMLALAVALFMLDRPSLNWLAMTGAVAAATVGSFSSFQGLLIWPVGLVLLYLRRRSNRVILVWMVSAGAIGVLYFYHFALHTATTRLIPKFQDTSFSLHHPISALKFFFFLIGDVVSVQTPAAAGAGSDAVVIFGVVIVAIAIWVVISYGRRRNREDGSPIGVALVCFGLLFALTVTEGRAALGIGDAGRYTPFVLPILIGSYLAVFGRSSAGTLTKPSHDALVKVIRTTLVGTICLQVVLGLGNGLAIGSQWHQSQLLAADVTVNIDLAPNDVVERALLPDPYLVGYVRQMTQIAKIHHLSLFATSAVALYTKEGLPAYHISPKTEVLSPSQMATLRGDKWLTASASDNFGVTRTSRGSGPSRVEFHLTGSALGAAVIVPATHLTYGWLGAWNTTTVPDGTYTLQSVAYDAAGNAAHSTGIVVMVKN